MATYGYARSRERPGDFRLQEKALQDSGCDYIHVMVPSGSPDASRTALREIVDAMDPGDHLISTAMERLVYSLPELQGLVETLSGRDIRLSIIGDDIDTADASAWGFSKALKVLSTAETRLREERRLAGIAAAKARGAYAGKGRPATLDVDQVRRMRHVDDLTVTQIATLLGVHRTSVARCLKSSAQTPRLDKDKSGPTSS